MDSQLVFGAVVTVGVAVLYILMGSHLVPEGHVGVYWQFGRLLSTTTSPGLHFTYVGVTRWEAIQTTMQTDKVLNIPCGTKGGAVVHFERIEVVNRLRKEAVYDIIAEFGTQYDKTWIYDKVHHEMNQFCSTNTLQDVYIEKFDQIDEIMQKALQDGVTNYAKGLDIIAVRVTKPKIPKTVLENYEALEVQRTKSMVAQVQRRLVSIESETLKQKELLETEIRIRKDTLEMEARLNVTRIQNTISYETQKTIADADSYRTKEEAAANHKLYTKEYISRHWASALQNINKVYFGPSLEELVSSIARVANSTALVGTIDSSTVGN